MDCNGDTSVDTVERAMVAIRRSQTRRVLARMAAESSPSGARSLPGSVFDVVDVVEAAAEVGTPTTVSGISTALNLDQPRASRLVATAVEAGLVRRVADQADGRRALLVTTDAGRALTAEAHRHRRDVFARVMSGWSANDRAEFARLLTRFVEGLGNLSR